MDLKVIYEDNDVLVVDKLAGLIVFPEGDVSGEKTLVDYLLEEKPCIKNVGDPPRYGIVHRLDKDTSGVLLVAKSSEALIFLQKQFSAKGGSAFGGISSETLEKTLEKRYIALAEGNVKGNGELRTFLARSSRNPRKQTVYLENEPIPKSARMAITEWRVVKRYQDYTLLEVQIKTGRRHQIRCHLSYLQHPIAGDKLYGFKNSKVPEGLARQFLHSKYLKIKMPDGSIKEFESNLPEELEKVLDKLQPCQN